MAYTTPSCMHMALLQLQALISIGLLLASMSSGSAEEAPSGYGMELIHVDANVGSTREDQLIQRVVDRSSDMLSATGGDDTPASSSSGTDSVAAVVHKRHLESYLMKLEIGKPPKPFWAVLDTGSDLVLTKQLCLCDRSASFTPVKCSDPDNRVTCEESCVFGVCMFNREFGNAKKDATGFIGRQTLSLSTTEYNNVLPAKNKEYNDVSIACAIDNDEELVPKSAQGIVGLNRGQMSLVRQLSLTSFAYCLSDEQSTRLWLGDAKKYPDKLQTTPLVPVEGIKDTSVKANMYYVKLEGISIGGNYTYRHLIPDTTKDEKGVMMLDSGHSRTKLEKSVFKALEDLLTAKYTTTENHEGRTCFLPPTDDNQLDLVLHFAAKAEMQEKYEKTENHEGKTCFRPPTDGKQPEIREDDEAKMHLPWASYMDEKSGRTKFCLAILENTGTGGQFQGSILGAFHQVNTYMHYNLTMGNEKLSFLQGIHDCHNA